MRDVGLAAARFERAMIAARTKAAPAEALPLTPGKANQRWLFCSVARPSREVAGVVVAVGWAVRSFVIGDRVFGTGGISG